MKKKLKNYIKLTIKFIKEHYYIFILAIPFFMMDLIISLYANTIDFYKMPKLPPILFSLSWFILFIGLILGFKKKIGKYIYILINTIFLIIFLTNIIYFSMTKNFFDFSLIESASEGAPYIIDTIKNSNILVFISFFACLFTSFYCYKYIPYHTKNNKHILIYSIIAFLLLHTICPLTLGKANKQLTWSSWRNPHNIYNAYNDSNKSIKVSGLYEYTIRNFYITFLKTKEEEKAEDIEFLDIAFEEDIAKNNKYTGIFKNKNLIFIQLEGLDDWLLTETDTPTLYKMKNNAINFNKHYSYYNGGGSTFNSEFAVNTGFITPLSYTQNAYTFNKNDFPYSMAKIFKANNYTVNAFHMNKGEYYSRTVNYKNWGYDNYYGLLDMFTYENNEHTLDRELILNEEFNKLMFPTDTNFVDYIIAYSSHLPFKNTKGVCKLLYDLDHANDNTTDPNEIEEDKEKEIEETKEIEIIEMTEEECVRRQVRETDYMVELLLQNLEEKNLIDNTVIIVFTDHYLYTIEDKTILDKYKETSNNLINKTPFFIWSKNTKKTDINKVTSQLNILPTTLNLFGIEYSKNNYIGSDALDPKYEGIVFFSDYSWYDGSVYVSGGIVTNNKQISNDKLEEKNYYISSITKKNDLALKFNYFKKYKKNNE